MIVSIRAASPSASAGSEKFANVRPLLFPRSAALIGVNERTSPEIIEAAVDRGIPVFGVHPRVPSVPRLPIAARLSDVPQVPELAFVLLGHRHLLAAVAEGIRVGVRAFVVPGLGNEAGSDAAAVTQALAELLASAEAVAIGPNGMGVATPGAASFWIGTVPQTFIPGHVSVVVHSGSIGEAILAVGPRIGFRSVVSPGGEIAADTADYCAFFADDPQTRAVGLCLETVRRRGAFETALNKLSAAGKPVVCLKLGRSRAGAAAVVVHNGADPGNERELSEMLEAHGVIQVDDYPLFLEVLEVLGQRHRPASLRIGGISNSGGEAALLADHAEASHIPFEPLKPALVAKLKERFPLYVSPQNPVDMWGVDEPGAAFSGTLEILVQSGEYDILIAQVDQSHFLGAGESENALRVTRALADAVEGTAIFGAVTSVQPGDPSPEVARLARERGVALLRGSQNAMRALAAVASWRPRIVGDQRG